MLHTYPAFFLIFGAAFMEEQFTSGLPTDFGLQDSFPGIALALQYRSSMAPAILFKVSR